MPHFLIEVPHEDGQSACLKALHALEQYGSHFVTNALFGCSDGAHCGWLLVELDSKSEAAQIVPPEFRSTARIVELQKFTREEIQRMIEQYGD